MSKNKTVKGPKRWNKLKALLYNCYLWWPLSYYLASVIKIPKIIVLNFGSICKYREFLVYCFLNINQYQKLYKIKMILRQQSHIIRMFFKFLLILLKFLMFCLGYKITFFGNCCCNTIFFFFFSFRNSAEFTLLFI